MKKEVNHNHAFIGSGIPGFDEVLNNGFRRNSSILIAGGPGAGKSIFALQFALGGSASEPSLYITTDETIESIREYAKSLGFDIEKQEREGKLFIIEQRPARGRLMTIEAPLKLIKEKKIKRVVLDSLTLFEYIYSSGIDEYRKGLLQFITDMKDSGVTLLATSERIFNSVDKFQYKPEDFLFEGVIALMKIRKEAVFERVVTIEKMRGQDHLLGLYPFQIHDKKGIEVFPKELPFSLVEEKK